MCSDETPRIAGYSYLYFHIIRSDETPRIFWRAIFISMSCLLTKKPWISGCYISMSMSCDLPKRYVYLDALSCYVFLRNAMNIWMIDINFHIMCSDGTSRIFGCSLCISMSCVLTKCNVYLDALSLFPSHMSWRNATNTLMFWWNAIIIWILSLCLLPCHVF